MIKIKAKLEVLFYNNDAFVPAIVNLIETAHLKYRPELKPVQADLPPWAGKAEAAQGGE
jgi:hypothetical protein